MEDVIDLQHLCIRLDRCITVKPGPIDPNTLHALRDRGFDQAPVYDASTNNLWGLVETKYLESKFEANQPLDGDDPILRDEQHEFHVGVFVTIFEVFQAMTQSRAVIVIRDSGATEYGHVEFVWGLFTISDLNRHAIRSAIYHLIAQVESGLAKFLEGEATDHWTWIKHLDEEQQARVLGYWELSKRKGVDVGPITAMTLAQLINVISREASAAQRLGFSSRSQFKKAVGRIPRLRNSVMHPIRPLVLSQSDVKSAQSSLLALDKLRGSVEKFLRGDHEA